MIVEVRRSGGDRAVLRVDVDVIDGRETLRVTYPDDEIRYTSGPRGGSTRLRVYSDGTFGHGVSFFRGDQVRISTSGGGTEAWADLRVLVPQGRDVAFYLGVGETRVDGVRGPLRLDTGHGSVRATSLWIPAPDRWRLGLTSDVDEIDVETGSGSVVIRVAESVGANVRIRTGSGRIQAEIPLVVRSSCRGRFEGVIGDGDGDIDVETGILSP